MDQRPLLYFLLLAHSSLLIQCLPDISVIRQGSYTASNTLSSGNGFTVSISETSVSGKCMATLNIFGNGIHKSIEYLCNSKPHTIINLQRTLLVGDEYYTDTPSVLIRLQGGKCVKETFYEHSGQYTSALENMTDTECEKVRVKITLLKQQQVLWSEWYNKIQQATLQQLQQLQNNLAALQQQVVSSIFGAFG